MSSVTLRAFTDPGCPLAFAAEPVRWRLLWLYGDQVAWEPRMVPLREVKEPEWRDVDAWRTLQARTGMPYDFERPRAWGNATVHACRAVVGVALRWPERRDAFLRRLRVLAMAGELLDDSDTLELAAAQAGLPVAELAAWCGEPEVDAALRAGAAGAPPSPTWEIFAGASAARLHGLEAIATAEAALAALDLARRPQPSSAAEVLRWAAVPLATAELSAVCGRDVRAELERTARFEPAGADGYWSLG